MSKIAYIFPGQGSQQVGMGKDFFTEYDRAKTIFSIADERLGYPLSKLCFEGPEDQLRLTSHTQPAILTTSIALWEVFRQQAPKPDYVAGHSLGEYSALVAAEAVSFEDAVLTVHKRGTFMEEALPAGGGTMAAVLGGDRDVVADICQTITLSGETVQMANLNCPGQIVISGTVQGILNAQQALKEANIKRVILLEVSGAFHSELMKPAASKLAHVLTDIHFQQAKIPVVTNVDARPVVLADDIEHSLVEQVFSPVLWEDSMLWMIEQGVDTFVEIGPGKVLSGLMKKINRQVTCFHIEDAITLQETLKALDH